MNIELSIVIAVIALISPIITTLINNKHQLKIKKMDMYEIEKRNALFNFIKACEDYMLSGPEIPANICSKYYASINNLYIFFSIKDKELFNSLEDTLKKQNIINSNHELNIVIQTLARQIKKE